MAIYGITMIYLYTRIAFYKFVMIYTKIWIILFCQYHTYMKRLYMKETSRREKKPWWKDDEIFMSKF